MGASGTAGLDIIRAYVEGQVRLGYGEFDPAPTENDILLATFPKSGSTWTSYLLHQLRTGGDDEFDDIKNVVVDITPGHWDPQRQPFAEAQEYRPRTYKTHGSYRLCPKGARYIYVCREPKDIFWSLYQFIHDLLGIEEWVPIDQFYSQYFVKRFDTGHDIGNCWDHILGWRPLLGQENMLWLHYEDIVERREAALGVIADYMGVELSPVQLENVVKNSSMDHMRTIAEKINPSPDNYVGRLVAGFGSLTGGYARKMAFGKIRKGSPGEGASSIPTELVIEMDREWKARITPVFGYSDYHAMRSSSQIL